MDRLFLDFQSAIAGRYALERELGRGGMGVGGWRAKSRAASACRL